MKVQYRKSFSKDLRKIKDKALLKRIAAAIVEVERATTLEEITGLKKLAATESCYRLRTGEYRLGLMIAGDVAEFVRCLHRRNLYRFFP